MSTVPRPTMETTPVQASARLANLLRWIGTTAVALSGVVFLLQGLEDLDVVFRHWSYLLLMALLTGCGVATRSWLNDAKSARLLLGLAVALVPVQFAQLGGLLHSLWAGEAASPVGLFDLHALSPAMTLAVGAATLLAAPLAAFTGFSVLVRPAARPLTWAFLLPNLLLVLPWRDSVAGFVVLAVIAALAPVLDRTLAGSSPRFATGEGRAVRAMLLIPAAIASVRLGFHVETLTGACALTALIALAVVYAARCHVSNRAVQELMYAAGTVLFSLAWMAWSFDALYDAGSWLAGAQILLPLAVIFIAAGRLSNLGRLYRAFAGLFALWATLTLTSADGLAASLAAMAVSVVVSAYGCLAREREPTVAGVTALLLATITLTGRVVAQIDVSSWLALAAAGVVLVLCASVVERFGRALLCRMRNGWADLSQWR